MTKDQPAAQPPWTARVLTLFPELFPGPLGASLSGQALVRGLWRLETLDIRAYASDKHATVDDAPFGGGPGMVMRPDVVDAAIAAGLSSSPVLPLVHLTPRGRPLDQAWVKEHAAGPGLVLLCGRYEGVDERVIEAHRPVEVSLGDFVLAGGDVAAMVLVEACGSNWRAGGAERGEFRARSARVSALHPAAGVAGSRCARGAAVRRPRADRPVAARAGGTTDAGAAPGPVGALPRRGWIGGRRVIEGQRRSPICDSKR